MRYKHLMSKQTILKKYPKTKQTNLQLNQTIRKPDNEQCVFSGKMCIVVRAVTVHVYVCVAPSDYQGVASSLNKVYYWRVGKKHRPLKFVSAHANECVGLTFSFLLQSFWCSSSSSFSNTGDYYAASPSFSSSVSSSPFCTHPLWDECDDIAKPDRDTPAHTCVHTHASIAILEICWQSICLLPDNT